MKKLLSLLLICALMSALFIGCTKKDPAPAPEEPTVSDPKPAPQEPETPANPNPDEPVPTLVTLYLPNENADGFDKKIVTVPGTPQNFVDALIENGALPAGVLVNSFSFTDGSASHIELDVSKEFEQALQSSGTAGESMYMGSLVNTMLMVYGYETISITCDGATIETGHTVYDSPMSLYDLSEQEGAQP